MLCELFAIPGALCGYYMPLLIMEFSALFITGPGSVPVNHVRGPEEGVGSGTGGEKIEFGPA